MRTLRIVFMGTPDFAVATLERILEDGYEVAGVITAPDRPAGRGRKLQQSAVKRYAVEKGLKVLQPTNLKDESFLEELRGLQANLQVVVAFRMLPRQVWEMPEFGTFNLHASLLPQYRGAAPINWAIINGEDKTGVTTFFIDQKIDTGAIIKKQATPINPDETAGDLHDRLMVLGAELVSDTLDAIAAGEVATQVQPMEGDLKEAPKLNKENCRIDWDAPLYTLYNKVRGLAPYPAAWSKFRNGNEEMEVKIYGCEVEKADHGLETGALVADKKSLKVAVNEGFVSITSLQLPGKRRLGVQEVLNGLRLYDNARMW